MAKKDASTICMNRRASFEYQLDTQFEAGLVLEGWEVKAIRAHRVSLNEGYAIVRAGEVYLVGCHISALQSASTHVTPDPTRTRKLLLHKQEIRKIIGATAQKGYTLVPLRMVWQRRKIKCIIALGKGKKHHDKRQSLKDKESKREQARALKSHH